jgi:2-dehydro-3-deoxyphosphooctonate aldolase (KDO 8-P synthase)
MTVQPVELAPGVTIGGVAGSFPIIAGPCVIENEDLVIEMAHTLAARAERLGLALVFKSSFDKANRSSIGSFRGPGLDEGLRVLASVKAETGLPVLTDVHEPDQCAPAAAVVDVLQIPAFLCRQTDLLLAAGETGAPVNIKKGQWMHPEGMAGATDKVRQGGSSELAVTERGTFFGYGDLVVDMRSFRRLRDACAAPVIFDGTHSVQQPGRGPGGASGGAREFIPSLTLAAVAAGADGLFLETHPNPASAPSDGPNMVPLAELDALIDRAIDIWDRCRR